LYILIYFKKYCYIFWLYPTSAKGAVHIMPPIL
jgi:hypothetical protein